MFKSLATQLIQEDSEELIQLINPEQDMDLKPDELPDELSILPIKNTVLFPGVVIPITVTRQKSIRLIKKANDLIEARHSLTTWEMRIFLKIVFLVNEEAHKGTTNFVIPIRELIKDFRLENSRQSYAFKNQA